MPSCVVKSCKISSDKFSKEKGITFHLFPKLMTWQWKWINVIRECRNQPEWLPSPVSVVCSVHFAESDIYTAKGGNRRIKRGAVPSINLYESIDITPNKIRRRKPNSTDKNVSTAIQTNAKLNTDGTPQNEMVIDDLESSTNFDEEMEQFIIKVEPTEDEETGEIQTQTNDLDEYFIIKEEPNEESAINTSINQWTRQQNAQNFSNTAADSNNYENELNVTKAQLNKYKKKVHLLHEKLKRSRKRNLKMKNILKEIKFRNLIDRDMFKQLTAVLFEN